MVLIGPFLFAQKCNNGGRSFNTPAMPLYSYFQTGSQYRLVPAIQLLSALLVGLSPLCATAQAQISEKPFNRSDLQGQVWQLQRVEYGNDETVTISDPSQYTLEFGKERVILLQADCNYGSGSYGQEGSQLDIELGPLTRALCPPDSFSEDYLRDLSHVVSYVMEEGDLFLSLYADGGIMQFSPASPKWIGPTWALTEMIYADYTIRLTQPGQYTLSFDLEGGVAVKADCNQSTGSYTQEEDELSIQLGPTTLVACPSNSLADPYVQALGQTATYDLEVNQLLITTTEQDITLVFEVIDAADE